MISHIEIKFAKLNDAGKLTTRGFFHLFTRDDYQGVMFVEVWGYKAGNGFARYMNLTADDWESYVRSRLDSKGLTQVDGKKTKITVSEAHIEDSALESGIKGLLSEKPETYEVDMAIKKFWSAPPTSESFSLMKAAYGMIAPRDHGGIEWNTASELKGMSATITVIDDPGNLAASVSKSPTYNEWGTY